MSVWQRPPSLPAIVPALEGQTFATEPAYRIIEEFDEREKARLRSTRAGTQPEANALSIGEPDLGRAVFENSCTSCYSLGGGEKSEVDLLPGGTDRQ